MAGLLARFENHAALRRRLLAQPLRGDRLRRAERTDLARLRLLRISHVEIEELLPLGEIVARHRIGVLCVEVCALTARNDRVRLERPWPGQLVRPRALNLLVSVLEANHEQ